MHSSRVLAVLLALVNLSWSSPTLSSDQGAAQAGEVDSYSISQVPVHGNAKKGNRRFGPVAYKDALAKYKANIPSHVSHAAAAATRSGAVTNQPEANDQEYLSPVQIGTPAKSLLLDFDTGSADLWVFSTELPSSESSGHILYNPGASSTSSKKQGYAWNITYGDGSGAVGNVFSDKVVVGPVTATSQAVEAATSVSSSFTSDTQNDGLLGLAMSSINTVTPTQQTTFFDTVKATLAQKLFAAYLRHNAAGVYDFGFIDTSKYTGTVGYVPINAANGFWEFNAGSYSVGGAAPSGTVGDSIADTGTSLLLVPNSVANNYYKQVKGASYSYSAGGYIFPCSSALKAFGITIGGAVRTVPASYINYASVGGGYCYGGVQNNQGLPFSILGDVFLKTQYVIFDGGNMRIGFATQK